MFGPTFALVLPLAISVAANERSIHLPPSAALASFIAVAVISAFSAYLHPRVPDSPLNIDSTVRILRGMLAVAPAAVGAFLLIPELRTVALRSVLTLTLCLAGFGFSAQKRRSRLLPVPTELAQPLIRPYGLLKRVCDIVAASIALIVLTPLFIVIAFAVKTGSRGPIFFTHERVGRAGRTFRMIKFRSMYEGVARYARSPTDGQDPRITAVGKVIRRLSLDELPQLINVVLGDMSLVGPRPEMPFIVRDYTAEQRERLNAVPGVTGLWQISPARALPIHKNMQYDLYYIAHQSFLLDAAILLRTAGAVVHGIGAQ